MVTLMLWVSGGPFVDAFTWETHPETCLAQNVMDDDEAQDSDHEEDNRVVLTSLEAAVIPVCKIQLAFFCSFVQELALIEKIVERVAVDVPLPQSNYFRTLFQLISPANAP